jgi:Mce-associated membrane protein
MTRRANLGLAVLVLLLGVAFTVLVVRDRDAQGAAGDPARADTVAARQDAATRAAAAQVHAFLDIDHTDVDAQLERMLEGTTEDFRRQFAPQLRTITAETKRRRSSADATVLRAGLGAFTPEAATVLVAADTEVTSTAGGARERRTVPWRIRVDLVRDGDRWLTSGLRFVN